MRQPQILYVSAPHPATWKQEGTSTSVLTWSSVPWMYRLSQARLINHIGALQSQKETESRLSSSQTPASCDRPRIATLASCECIRSSTTRSLSVLCITFCNDERTPRSLSAMTVQSPRTHPQHPSHGSQNVGGPKHLSSYSRPLAEGRQPSASRPNQSRRVSHIAGGSSPSDRGTMKTKQTGGSQEPPFLSSPLR